MTIQPRLRGGHSVEIPRREGAAAWRWRASWTWILLAVSAIAGCTTVSSQTSTLVEYRRSGGIAGRDEQLVVRSDGTARVTRRRAVVVDFEIEADSLAQLRSLLDGIEFRSLKEEYLPPRTGADLFEYVVIYGGRKVRTMDTAIPSELEPLISFLSGQLNRHR